MSIPSLVNEFRKNVKRVLKKGFTSISQKGIKGFLMLYLKGQSHGDLPIFFIIILINLYQSTLITHELLLDHQGDNIIRI